ncbi:hypothetical protein ACEZCY_21135 [Streptacidiphilus sp. N1-12]|uniref:Uncharacterized protein n=2 Tax=Streptacidiphilus alkalitolerans TaxID=3342712 RepID=A0ABV6VDG1_9ACTN
MIGLVAAFLAGCAVTFALTRLLDRRAAHPALGPGGGRPRGADRRTTRVDEAVTAFGEQLEHLDFDPAAATVTEAMLADYQAALDAYDRAKLLPVGDEARIARTLDRGRAALVRLSARVEHRPIPIEALEGSLDPAPAVRADADRFLHSGTAPGTFEVLVDRPEPGRPTIAEISFKGNGNFFVRPVIRTDARFETGQTLVNYQKAYRGRHLIDDSTTHLKVELQRIEGACRWSVRFLPISEALPLDGLAHGSAPHEVLAHSGGRTTVTVQARTTGTWRVDYRSPTRDSGTDWIHGLGDGAKELPVPAAGWILVQFPQGGTWSLQTPS